MADRHKKSKSHDDLMDINESAIKYIADTPNTRRYSISKSGRFKQIVKHREALDETLFNDQDKVIDCNESVKSTSYSSTGNKKKNSNSSLGKKSYTEIEAWIENSFRQTFEDYKTLRKKSNASVKSNPVVDSDGHLETAL